MMKKQNGITLIALIITIVVMLILVAVTLMIALGENGVITTTKNAKKEHEAEAFKEYVEIVAASHYEADYEWASGLTVSGRYDFIGIQSEIKNNEEYKDTKFTYNLVSLPTGAMDASTKSLLALEGTLYCAKETYNFIENSNLSGKLTATQKNRIQNALNNSKQKFIDEEIERRWPESAEEFKNLITVEDITLNLSSSSHTGTIQSALLLNESLFGPVSSMVAEYNGISVPIGFVNTNMYDYYVTMDINAAKKIFEFTDIVEEDGMRTTTIRAYKGNAKNVKVPATLTDGNEKPIFVSGIESYAFTKMYMKIPLINLLTGRDPDDTDYDEVLYNNTATLADFKAELGMSEMPFDCGHQEGDQCTKLACKNGIIEAFVNSVSEEDMEDGGVILGDAPLSECIATESDGILYGYFNVGEYAIPVRPSDFVESNIQTILVSEGIQSIGDYAFANSPKLKEVYLPSSLEDIGDDIFTLCNSLTTIKTMNEDIAESTDDYGCQNEINKIYIEPKMDIK